jgi:uncharacterized protein (TIGR03118 family)
MKAPRFAFLILLVLAVLPAESAVVLRPSTQALPLRTTTQALVSDGSADAVTIDPDLINPWGIAFNAAGAIWIADNGTDRATIYNGAGAKQPLVVSVRSSPTGVVFNSGNEFVVAEGDHSGPARFLFATKEGTIAGWSPVADATKAIVMVDNGPSGAVYTGLALASTAEGRFLYAADFRNARVDVFDDHFRPVSVDGAFDDPLLPPGFAPFGIHAVQGTLYVTYAKPGPRGPGSGVVDEFDAGGALIRRFAARGRLNAPWGVAFAPGNFGAFSNTLLVGNFGDGKINAFDLASGRPVGQLRVEGGRPLVLEGLWELTFGSGATGLPTNSLFFTAGPDDERHGIFGRIDQVPSE